ncbi:MAG: hypothetical protein KME55_42065 [Nostoc indistinguendum CM1-VF10]|nr:hypothetical protein [Nostoc indistinguendum CM1-VF10]
MQLPHPTILVAMPTATSRTNAQPPPARAICLWQKSPVFKGTQQGNICTRKAVVSLPSGFMFDQILITIG